MAAGQKRISCLFVANVDNYMTGETAVFPAATAYRLKKAGAVELLEHEVKDDSGLLELINGQNQDPNMASRFGGVSDEKIDEKISKMLDEKLKPILDLLDKDKASKSDDKPDTKNVPFKK